MSQFSIFAGLIFSLIIAVFALANSQPVLINYLFGKAEVSAIIVILCSAVSGAFVIFLFNLVRHVKASFQLRGLRNDLRIMKEKMQELEKERDFFQVQAGQFQQAFTEAGDALEFPGQARSQNIELPEENTKVKERKDQI